MKEWVVIGVIMLISAVTLATSSAYIHAIRLAIEQPKGK